MRIIHRSAGWVAGLTAACLAAAAYALWPLPRHLASAVTPVEHDPLFIATILAWGAHALRTPSLSVWDAPWLHPQAGTTAVTENYLGISAPLAPVFWLTGNPALSLNLATLLTLAAAGVGTGLLLRAARVDRWAALVGALAVTVLPYRIAQVDHLHVIATHLLPFALLAALWLTRRPGWRPAVALGLVCAWALWSSMTGGVLTLLAVGCWGLALLVLRRRAAVAPLAWAAGGLALGLLLAAPLAVPYTALQRAQPELAHTGGAVPGSATPSDYLRIGDRVGGPLGPLYAPLPRAAEEPRAGWEKTLFPGLWQVGMLAVGAVLVLRPPRRHAGAEPGAGAGAEPDEDGAVPLLALTGALLVAAGALLSVGPNWGADPGGLRLPTAPLYEAVPLLRAPMRLGQLVPLGVTLLAALALGAVPRRARAGAAALSAALVLLAAWPAEVPLIPAPAITPAFAAVADRPGAVLALPAMTVDPATGAAQDRGWDQRHLYRSTANFRPVVNGVAQTIPTWYADVARQVQDLPSPGSLAALRAIDVRTIVIDTALVPGTPWADTADRLAAEPGVTLLAEDPGVQVYALP